MSRRRWRSKGSTGGIGFVGLLTIVFITLKLTGHITWSWWWVLSPMWISALAVGSVIAIGVVLIAMEEFAREAKKK